MATRSWEFFRALDPSSSQPLFVQLAQAIAQDIAANRLAPGQRLPGSRTLAKSLGIHRNTVLAAYAELASEGWIIAREAQATVVAASVPVGSLRMLGGAAATAMPQDASYELLPATGVTHPVYPSGTLVLARAAPDVRLLPIRELASAYRRVLLRHGPSLLFYGDPRGHPRMRSQIAAMLAETRGMAATTETVLVTRGSQMAIDLAARTLLRPGDVVAVEALGHPLVWAALRAAGAELVTIPIDDGGLVVSELAKLVAKRPIRAVYVTPHHQFPTNVVMPADRRRALLALARLHRFAVLEDDYDHEFHYEARPLAPIASADEAGCVVYLGTLSKLLAPGLRLGFLVAPRVVIDRMAGVRAAMDLQGDHAIECAVAELFEDGELQRHVRRMRGIYHARRDALVAALRCDLPEALTFDVPAGGMAIWARVAPAIDLARWVAAGAAHQVAFANARDYAEPGCDVPCTRLSFTYLDEHELAEAVSRMKRALIQISGRAGAT
ncbi:MAG: PLP-dependent aminotransferase family protein [Kofleriaceae bacterium]